MLKRIGILLILGVILIGLTGCSGSDDKPDPSLQTAWDAVKAQAGGNPGDHVFHEYIFTDREKLPRSESKRKKHFSDLVKNGKMETLPGKGRCFFIDDTWFVMEDEKDQVCLVLDYEQIRSESAALNQKQEEFAGMHHGERYTENEEWKALVQQVKIYADEYSLMEALRVPIRASLNGTQKIETKQVENAWFRVSDEMTGKIR